MSSLGVWLHGRRDALQDVVGMGWSDELFYNLLNMYHVLYFWIMKEMILLKAGLMYCLNVVIHLCRVQSQSYIHAGEVFILKREREKEKINTVLTLRPWRDIYPHSFWPLNGHAHKQTCCVLIRPLCSIIMLSICIVVCHYVFLQYPL